MKQLIGLFIFIIISLSSFATVEVTLKAPSVAEAGAIITVEMTVTNMDTSGFARIKQDFPVGFEVIPVDIKNASFYFDNNQMRLIWEKSPSGTSFNITLQLMIDANATGTISYGRGQLDYQKGKMFETVIIQSSNITISNSSVSLADASKKYSNSNELSSVTLNIPQMSGLVYRVQVAASTSKKNVSEIKKRYSLNDNVYEDYFEGIYRYLLGDYKTLEEAKKKSEEFHLLTGIVNFVSVYESGKRIPISEAMNKSKIVK